MKCFLHHFFADGAFLLCRPLWDFFVRSGSEYMERDTITLSESKYYVAWLCAQIHYEGTLVEHHVPPTLD